MIVYLHCGSGQRHVQTSQLINIPSEAHFQNQASSSIWKTSYLFRCRITVEGCEKGAAQILFYRRFVTLHDSGHILRGLLVSSLIFLFFLIQYSESYCTIYCLQLIYNLATISFVNICNYIADFFVCFEILPYNIDVVIS